MVWNEPGNNGNKDPLGFGGKSDGPKKNNPDNSGQNNQPQGSKGHDDKNNNPWDQSGKSTKQTQPVQEMFDKLLKNKKNRGSGGGNSRKPVDLKFSPKLIPGILLGALALWAVGGFYTVKEAELAVITRFGAFHQIQQPGLNWRPLFIDEIKKVDIKRRFEINSSGRMLTSDEKLIDIVEMNIKYTIADPKSFLFSVVNPNDSLAQALDSALRGIIGRNQLETILTKGRDTIRFDTKTELERTIAPYNMGVQIEEVNFQEAKPPREVQDAFDDAIAARENEQQLINEAGEYRNRQLPLAKGEVERIIQNANAIKETKILQAEGEVARFSKLLPEYQANPEITRQRLYIETMEKVLSETRKVIMGSQNNNLTVLPMDQLLKGGAASSQIPVTQPPAVTGKENRIPTQPESFNQNPAGAPVNSSQQSRTLESTLPQGRVNNATDRLNAIRGGN